MNLIMTCKNCTEPLPFDPIETFKDQSVLSYRVMCHRCNFGNLVRRPAKKVNK